MRIEDPIKIDFAKDNEDYTKARIEALYGHANHMGFFPIGRLNFWHGGVHIDGNHAITAIADGRIIAYRMATDYTEETFRETTSKYSNGFMLIQHYYRSPQGKTLRFYSLYHHLMPKTEMEEEAGKNVPEFYAKHTITVKKGKTDQLLGLAARSSKSSSIKKKGQKVHLIPIGHTFTLDPKKEKRSVNPVPLPVEATTVKPIIKPNFDGEWAKGTNYKRIKFTDIDGVEHRNVYTYVNAAYNTPLGGGVYKVIYPTHDQPDTIYMIKGNTKTIQKGALIYDKPDHKGKGKLLKVVSKGTSGEAKKVNKHWYKVKDKEEYIQAKDVDVVTTLKDDIVYDTTTDVDVPVKAGDIIGHTGMYGYRGNEKYRAVHLEVFTDDPDLEEFLKNTQDNDRTRYKTKANIKIWNSKPLKKPLPKKTKVKVYQRKGNFAQIGFENFERDIPTDGILWTPNRDGKEAGQIGYSKEKGYAVLDEKAANSYLDNALEKGVSKLIYKAKIKINNQDGRTVTFTHPRAGQKYWVDGALIPEATPVRKKLEPIALQPKGVKLSFGTEILKEPQEEESSAEMTTTPVADTPVHSGEEQQWLEISDTIERVYEKEPDDTTIEFEEFKPEVEFKTPVSSVELDDILWWKIKGKYRNEEDNLLSKEGWVQKAKEEEGKPKPTTEEEPDLQVLNPYNWLSYGWKQYDNTDGTYIYDFKDEKDAPDFIKEVWEMVDLPETVTNQNGTVEERRDRVLNRYELQQAMRVKKKVRALSHMIIKHPSEWDYKGDRYASLKAEVEELYKKGIDQEEDAERRQEMEQIRDEKLALLEEKINALCFWKEIKDIEIAKPEEKKEEKKPKLSMLPEGFVGLVSEPKVEEPTFSLETEETTKNSKEKRTFPVNNSNVWHFHPIAFVEHFKMLQQNKSGECYCNRELTVEEFKNIFTRIRKSEKLGNDILSHSNCSIPNEDKTFDRLTEEFNKTTKKYGINQCIQKMHFIAQLYWESARFTTGLEFVSGDNYNPGNHKDAKLLGNTLNGDGPKYKGRGFMQLTWRNTQLEYLKYAAKHNQGVLKDKTDIQLEKRSNSYEIYISDDLAYAMDSAGWFWSKYKKIAFKTNSSKTKYSDILGETLNEVALKGDKYINIISTFVNGGGNGKSERKDYYKILKNIFKYNYICINNENKREIVTGDEAPWVKYVYQEFIEYQGVKEDQSPLKEKIKEYHNSSTAKGKNYKISWCASFVSWCFEQAGYKNINSGSNSFAFDWAPEGNRLAKEKSDSFRTPDPNLTGWIEGEECKPFVGAVIVLSYSHCAVIVGKNTKENKYVYIGGNQGKGIQEIKYGTVNIGKEYAIMKPIRYNPKSFELLELDKNEDGNYFTTH
ncbi:hypothetical protein [Aquimarina sp. RZ0]|uniref:hypothetical protein n=1 Tax=Aquimarina sp. RZ0 TaxID=2607730 RepID=UPI0011F24970|nr:hypothetical protein [Aquimarina sp. RZ0]KAA1244508.1 hypothetical protein F0000_16100 [Aquimarina sp. RZ0]